eukprot:CAMPEP_0170500280 /NCGR_PEP_ID=MMETSP0208-20121228/34330_1 /TAXON_ID=197538 /ORGANISM="Strombidium inclinatum, Strain S3" /LENGTH=60 /DNA_ID=CAMNT_0010778243 /DNA_START=177 /DNA_END=359 /DNA_ORIENTATION=-
MEQGGLATLGGAATSMKGKIRTNNVSFITAVEPLVAAESSSDEEEVDPRDPEERVAEAEA